MYVLLFVVDSCVGGGWFMWLLLLVCMFVVEEMLKIFVGLCVCIVFVDGCVEDVSGLVKMCLEMLKLCGEMLDDFLVVLLVEFVSLVLMGMNVVGGDVCIMLFVGVMCFINLVVMWVLCLEIDYDVVVVDLVDLMVLLCVVEKVWLLLMLE